MLQDFPIPPAVPLVLQGCLQACTCRMAELPSHHTQHSGALTKAVAVPALNIDKRQDYAWWKDKAMCPSPNTAG